MEKIKVNMSPNPLDVQTIHASQNDTEARQWEFELHNNGELIDTSDVKEQLVFKAYKGGTEQLLPENTSTPTTSPFLGDIRYPQGLLTDQEFTYRQSPTEEDGLAKITDVKGNTLVWNQLVQNGNFADTSRWTSVASATINSVSNNTINVTTSATVQSGISNPNLVMVQNHKYLLVGTVKTTGQTYISISGVGSVLFNTNSFVTKSNIFTWTSASGNWACMIRNWDANSATFEAKNIMLFDLTKMGLDSITDPSEFTSLFPLSYYSYNQGSLLSFNGNGIKTANEDESEEHNTTLPISTYFPTGMKSAGSVYDELTESKAITRVGSRAYQSGDESDTSVITDGTTTYYALVTPTETSFTTASLVTENAEIPLSNNDGTLIGKCTEELSAEPGFHDAKIKLSDSDGECYSNKIQLHVERSPQ